MIRIAISVYRPFCLGNSETLLSRLDAGNLFAKPVNQARLGIDAPREVAEKTMQARRVAGGELEPSRARAKHVSTFNDG